MIPDLDDKEEIKRIIREVDPTVRLWDCTPSWVQYHKREFDFESDGFNISIIDPFKGRIPTVISGETLSGEQSPLIPTILLDSNVIASLHRFVSHPNKLPDNQKKVIINLLDYLIHERVDYNPVFYYLESFSKSDIDSLIITEYSKSILCLHMMDELHFLKRREVRPSAEILEKYANKFGTNNVDEIANIQDAYIRGKHERNDDWKIMYLIILKAAVIQKTDSSNPIIKTRILYEFTYNVFGALFSEELFIATHYFSGKLDKFIPLQKGANFARVINKLKATAWDLYLLRMPAILLSFEEPPFPFAAICTGDKSLQYIGRKMRIRRLYTTQGAPFPELEMDFSDIIESSKAENPIIQLFNEFGENRNSRRRYMDTGQVLSNIDNIIREIEDDARKFCQARV